MLPRLTQLRLHLQEVRARAPAAARVQVTLKKTSSKLFGFGDERFALCHRRLVGAFVREHRGQQAPNVFVVRRPVSQCGVRFQVDGGVPHDVDGRIDQRRAIRLRPMHPERDKILDPTPDARRKVCAIDNEGERTGSVAIVLVNRATIGRLVIAVVLRVRLLLRRGSCSDS